MRYHMKDDGKTTAHSPLVHMFFVNNLSCFYIPALYFPQIKTDFDDLKSDNLTLTEAINVNQNRTFWRPLSTSGATPF